MDALQGLGTNLSSVSLTASQAVNPVSLLLLNQAASLGTGQFGQGSTIVALSGAGQVFSAAAIFQDQLAALHSGSDGSGIGENFGNDVASLAAEAQFLVDAFNGVQDGLTANALTGGLGSSATLAAAFSQDLGSASQAVFDNGDSTLTRLSQIGINFTASVSAGGHLSVDLATLKSAFATDGAGAFSLLQEAAQAFSTVAGEAVGQARSSFDVLSALTQLDVVGQFLGGNSSLVTGNNANLSDLMLLEFLGAPDSGSRGTLNDILALNQFNLVSSLLG